MEESTGSVLLTLGRGKEVKSSPLLVTSSVRRVAPVRWSKAGCRVRAADTEVNTTLGFPTHILCGGECLRAAKSQPFVC